MHCPTSAHWRPAWLRGSAAGPEGSHALVLISAGQYLRVPVDEEDLVRWCAVLDRPVWVDLATRPFAMRLERPSQQGGCHA